MSINTTKCLIVDDEPIARKLLTDYISKLNFLELVATCEDALDALQVLSSQEVDLLFCDIRMPEMSGLEFVKTLKGNMAVIFTTAYAEFAVNGFDLGVVDYLTKPIEFERFVIAVQRAQEYLVAHSNQTATTEQMDRDIFIKQKGKMFRIPQNDIIYIESVGGHVKIITNNELYTPQMTMITVLSLLDQKTFIRIHRGYIVNSKKIHSFNAQKVEISDGISLPLSPQYRASFYNLLGL